MIVWRFWYGPLISGSVYDLMFLYFRMSSSLTQAFRYRWFSDGFCPPISKVDSLFMAVGVRWRLILANVDLFRSLSLSLTHKCVINAVSHPLLFVFPFSSILLLFVSLSLSLSQIRFSAFLCLNIQREGETYLPKLKKIL
ncbi:hypothetical protein Bca4012_055612 [Brassica carinata]